MRTVVRSVTSPEIPNPSRSPDRVDGIGGIEHSAADPFASDCLPGSTANPKNTPFTIGPRNAVVHGPSELISD